MFTTRRLTLISFAGLLLLGSIAAGAGVNAGAYLGARPTPTPTPKTKTTPTPAPTPNVSPTPAPVQTLDTLRAKITQRMLATEVRRGRVGIKIVSLNTGKVVFENDADKYFMPASNMKNFTVAAALEKLGPDFKFVTRIFGPKPDSSGTVPGDLRILGAGDITISTAFFGTSVDDPETYYKGIDRLVDKIAAAGIKQVNGDLVGDESYFRGFYIPTSWEWDDLEGKDGTGISTLPINDSDVDLSIKPGVQGGPCIVTISPPNTLFKIENVCWTSVSGSKRQLSFHKKLDSDSLWVGGSMPVGDKGYSGILALSHPADLFMAILKERLARRGITIAGKINTTRNSDYHPLTPLPPFRDGSPDDRPDLASIELTRLESPPFSIVASKTMKPSQNMYAETILWTLGEQTGHDPNEGESTQMKGYPISERPSSADLGIAAAKKFRDSIGIPADAVVQQDGSGMSRHDLITPNAVIALYTYMAKQSKYAQVWRDSLTIGGVDGTLRNRFKGTAAAGNMRGKTGTLDQVSALSGYVTTAGGEQFVVSIIINDVPGATSIRTSLADDIVVALANFNGKIDQ